MLTNQLENSSLSYKDIVEKKVTELMPPPLPLKRLKIDYIQELRKNLIATENNNQQNKQLQEELKKISLMNGNFSNSIHHETLGEEDNQLSFNNIRKLKTNLIEDDDAFMKFNKFPNPQNKKEIKFFVNNLASYMNYLLNSQNIKHNLKEELQIMKYKLETRYNDYINQGLYEKYFIEILSETQTKLIKKVSDILKSEDSSIFINEYTNFSFIGKKRKKPFSEIKSITHDSSSYEEDNNVNCPR